MRLVQESWPQICALMRANLEELDLKNLLSSLAILERGERIILGNFGTVQTLLSLVFGEPVSVTVVHQRDLGGVIVRRAHLMAGDEVVCDAVSFINCSKNNEDLLREMRAGQLGIGQILARYRLATRRSLIRVGRGHGVFWRLYIIRGDGVSIQIEETFPRQPFEKVGWLTHQPCTINRTTMPEAADTSFVLSEVRATASTASPGPDYERDKKVN